MSVIKDIRIYRSTIENIDGNSWPYDFPNKELNCVIHRIVMKLRENAFSLGDFDHLYINFTTTIKETAIAPASRSIDRYHPWYRFFDVGVNQSFYDNLPSPAIVEAVVQKVKQVLLMYFCTTQDDSDLLKRCISDAVSKGEEMLMLYKVKQTKNNKAIVLLRYLNNTQYFPLIRVYNLEGKLLLEKDLPKTKTLDPFGEIQLSSKKVTIKPRKNSYSKKLKPIILTL